VFKKGVVAMNIEDFLSKLQKVHKTTAGWDAICPAHDDAHPSLGVSLANDGKILVNCRSAHCSAEQITASMGLKLSDLFNDADKAQAKEVKPKRVASFQYVDEMGNELYVIDRYEPGRHGKKKDFFQRHLVNGKYEWKMDGVRRVLYRLPEIIKATEDQEVFICEGEGKADILCALGYVATSSPGGSAKWMDAFTEFFRGKDLVLCPDNDATGQDYLKMMYSALKPVAKRIRIVTVPKPHNDIRNYIPLLETDAHKIQAVTSMLENARPCPNMEHEKIHNMEIAERSYAKFCQDNTTPRLLLNKWLPGLNLRRVIPGEVVTIIAATSVGKSLLAYNIVLNAGDMTSLIFQLELPELVTFERFGAMTTGASGEEIERTYIDGGTISWRNSDAIKRVWFCSESGLTIEAMKQLTIEAESVIGKRPDIVVVDYLQLAQGIGKTVYEKASDVADSLRVFAKNMNVIVIVTSQVGRPMNRQKHWNEDDIPDNMSFTPVTLSSGKNSGNIENSAAVVIGAWRSKNDPHRMYVQVLKGSHGGASPEPIVCRLDPKGLRITETHIETSHTNYSGDTSNECDTDNV
jgi:hypothetical protein